MGRKKKAVAEDAPETEGEDLDTEQRQALFFSHRNKIKTLREELASVNGKLRQAYKAAKADGVAKKDLAFSFELENNDEAELLDARRRQDEIARWMQHPVGMQADLFEGVDRTPAADRAYELGKVAGMEAKPKQPPYDVHTEQGQRWMEGWQDGQAAIFNIQRTRDAEAFDGDGLPPPIGGGAAVPEHATA